MATAQVMDVSANVPYTKSTGPCVMIIFGAAGDLTKRKLLPSIYNLLQQNLLSREFAIVGVSRDDYNTEKFRKHVSDSLGRFCQGADHELVELRPSCTQIINPAVLHAEKTADTGLDEAATERRLIDHHEDVQGVAVLGQSLRNEAVIAGIMAR